MLNYSASHLTVPLPLLWLWGRTEMFQEIPTFIAWFIIITGVYGLHQLWCEFLQSSVCRMPIRRLKSPRSRALISVTTLRMLSAEPLINCPAQVQSVHCLGVHRARLGQWRRFPCGEASDELVTIIMALADWETASLDEGLCRLHRLVGVVLAHLMIADLVARSCTFYRYLITCLSRRLQQQDWLSSSD